MGRASARPIFKNLSQTVIFRMVRARLFESTETEQCGSVGLVATETLEEHHGILRVARLKDDSLMAKGILGIEDAFLLKLLPGIGLKHLAPEIGVVA